MSTELTTQYNSIRAEIDYKISPKVDISHLNELLAEKLDNSHICNFGSIDYLAEIEKRLAEVENLIDGWANEFDAEEPESELGKYSLFM